MTLTSAELHIDAASSSKEKRAELLLSGLVDHALVIIDPSGQVIEWDGAAPHITGYPGIEVLGQRIDFLFTAEDKAAKAPAEELATALRGGKTTINRWYVRKNGTRFFAMGSMTPLYDKSGELIGFSKVFLDETERQKDAERSTLLLNLARHILESPEANAKLSSDVFEMIREPLELDVFVNYRIAQRGDLYLVAEAGIPNHLKLAAARLDAGQAFCGIVAATKAPVVANTEYIQNHPAGAFALQVGVTACTCHPLFGRDGKVLGTFSVASTTRNEFLASEIEFLQTVSHLLAIAWDRHQAETEVVAVNAESERRKRLYETILSNTPDLAYVFDLDHRFTYANEILLAMWGKTWDEAIGKTCLELGYEPWHAEMHDREIEYVKKTKLAIRGEVPFDGTFGRRIYDYIFVPVIGADGNVEAVAGTTRDITNLKQSQEETAKLLEIEKQRAILIGQVAEASQSLNTLLSAKSIAQLVTEKARTIIGAHQAAISITSSSDSSDTIQAISLSESHSPTSGNSDATNKLINPRAINDLRVPLLGKGEQNLGWLQLSNKYEGDFSADDESILMQLAVIAAAGIENASLYEKLQEQDRRKDEFIATLAHELRNPLAPIRSAVSVLTHSELTDPNNKTLKMMERQVSHMVHLIDDLLDVSRISNGKIQLKKEQVQLDTIIESALEVSRLALDANHHSLEIIGIGKNIRLDADPIRIAQVISNLLNNAAKYTPTGGRIELIIEQLNNEAIIRVKDNGVGITPDMTSKIFELFTQAGKTLDRTQGGLGIGLAISKQLIEMHGGLIQAESEGSGKGALFTIRLPVAQQQKLDDNKHLQKNVSNSVSSHRILVVDDNSDAADMLTVLLQFLGHDVKTVYNGFDAITLATTYQPELVLLDIGLPGMNGYETAQQLIENPLIARPVLVALTGWGTQDDKKRAQDAGFDYHFTKPIEITKIEQLLTEIWAAPEN